MYFQCVASSFTLALSYSNRFVSLNRVFAAAAAAALLLRRRAERLSAAPLASADRLLCRCCATITRLFVGIGCSGSGATAVAGAETHSCVRCGRRRRRRHYSFIHSLIRNLS